MNKIILYREESCQGESVTIQNTIADLSAVAFSSSASSLKVVGLHWVAYKEPDLKGEFNIYGQASYNNLGTMDKEIASLRLVTEKLDQPQITLYSEVNFQGRSANFQKSSDDVSTSGLTKVSSQKKVEGVWVLYDDTQCKGNRMITFAGDEIADYQQAGWKGTVASLHCLKSSDKVV
ncbi:epidermal differentiation-specific protein-like [Scyliorhinus canicula]|uniref:epidermal differentiation-specific protein-like n=1 Tax=Scyliorhinus canicula TaxID=7830 RepID=UPI0018F293C4|nr:epidermal differentiation-specific protein-like [Scyliorhinus canicula]